MNRLPPPISIIYLPLSRSELLQRPRPLLLPLLLANPHRLLIRHDIRQHRTSQEHHVSPPRRVLNAHLELAEALWVPAQDAREPQLLELLLETRRQAGVHAATTREHDGLEEGRAHVNVGGLDGVEEELGNTGLLDVDEMGLEEALCGFEALAADADDAAIGEGIALDQDSGFLRELLV
jgi:hypothetical protein